MDYKININYVGALTADQKTKGKAFVESLGLEVNGDDRKVTATKIITYYEEEEVSL